MKPESKKNKKFWEDLIVYLSFTVIWVIWYHKQEITVVRKRNEAIKTTFERLEC
jgi:uncharacterized membrane protein